MCNKKRILQGIIILIQMSVINSETSIKRTDLKNLWFLNCTVHTIFEIGMSFLPQPLVELLEYKRGKYTFGIRYSLTYMKLNLGGNWLDLVNRTFA